ncbi:Rhoptry kinase family protein ROP35, putative [Eimeria mitis]|uniref:Rhoptry kinase family protein ROP35, putative n=1 Tax=Eimeria mitis TaxID=44415 RepID=U6KC23_9EIME|nr:Rhoptry kinase family protein ROP35, putative [Eimeria mitis]CDJ35489.1 Rhoptry kinase family protein ROP35, putative [Eimeria mitis]
MSLRTALVAALSTSLCCSLLAVGSSDANSPSLASGLVPSAGEAADDASLQQEAASEQVGDKPIGEQLLEGEETLEEEQQPNEGPDSSSSNGLPLLCCRSMAQDERAVPQPHPSPPKGKDEDFRAMGSLFSAVALWRKTSELYHSPAQALRKAKMRILGQVPHSWDDYVRGLPVLDELEFPEIRPLLKRLDKKPVVLMSMPKPRARLASFLGLTEEQREEGIVIKGKSTAGCSPKEVAFELFAHERLAKGLPLSLPALGAFRDIDGSTLYLITPRARADVSLYTRRMPEKVFDYKTDVFALGVTFREMLEWMGSLPVPHRDLAEDLIKHMTDADTRNRYDLPQCMQHPYFEGIDFELVEKKMYGKAFEGNYQTPYKFL